MHNYIVNFATYDGSGSDQNPLVWVQGTVDGKPTAYIQVYWAAIQQYASGGTAALQAYLATILMSGVFTPLDGHTLPGPPFPPAPPLPSGPITIPAPVTGQINGTSTVRIPSTAYGSVVVCTQAMVPPWAG
jgi:hypothetical protein